MSAFSRRSRLRYLALLWVSLLVWQTTAVNRKQSEEASYATDTPIIVELPAYGKVQGVRQSAMDLFAGIPYAAPPVGRGRWEPPQRPQPWEPLVWDASNFAKDCWQIEDPVMNPGVSKHNMDEDCLYLNIYTPAGLSTPKQGTLKQLPVMVWLHGGAFQQGGAHRPEYDGRRLAERGVVVVTMNYRLGSLGFLVSSSDGIFGNFGLMDQRAALHWIQENIQHFGGDPTQVTLFGESAGGVMAGLHLMMEGAGELFHKVIIQSFPLGFQFRSVVIADFLGEALKRSLDCLDAACLRAEPVEEIIRAQRSLMGIPRSVGDFFTWGPTKTHELQQTYARYHGASDLPWASVNVTQPLQHLDQIPDDIPLIIGVNKHEGEMFVHGAFPISMSKPVYWMFVGALFRDSAARVLKHYRGYVEKLEQAAEEQAQNQVYELKSHFYYMDHKEELEQEYQQLVAMNESRTHVIPPRLEALVRMWKRGGDLLEPSMSSIIEEEKVHASSWLDTLTGKRPLDEFNVGNVTKLVKESYKHNKLQSREERIKWKAREKTLRDASKIAVDYRPVMSRMIGDYLFRCPTWHFAHALSRNRMDRSSKNNVFVYKFSHSTHIPGFKECWGKVCHTSEIPYVFQAMEIIRSNYSIIGPYAQAEAPMRPEYPYTEIMNAYQASLESGQRMYSEPPRSNHTHNINFRRILSHFFGEYFREDADFEIASDMADRWAAFARNGDPNFEGSKAIWRPWMFNYDNHTLAEDSIWEINHLRGLFDDLLDEQDDIENDEDSSFIPDQPDREQRYRNKVLAMLGYEVIEEDVFSIILRRLDMDEADNFLRNRVAGGIRYLGGRVVEELSYTVKRQLREIAQDMGIIGKGLQEEHPRVDGNFFPELMVLKWPPEGRLIERDCTCDMWDRVRCKLHDQSFF